MDQQKTSRSNLWSKNMTTNFGNQAGSLVFRWVWQGLQCEHIDRYQALVAQAGSFNGDPL